MGWASGLQAGIQLGNAFKQGQERRRMEDIQQATPETSQGYTAEQGAQLEAMAKAINPETGRPYYQVNAGEGGNYTVTPDFTESQRPVGLTGTPTENAPIAYDQQRVTNFLGKRYEGELAPERVEGLRTRAMAEATADPRMRQQMLMEATRAEREAVEAPLRLQGLKQSTELGGVQLTAAQRAEKMAAANEQADVALAEMRANGTPINSQTLAQLAKSSGADYNNLLKNELNQLGFNEKTAAVEMKNLSKEWSRAALGGAASINKFLTDKFDPDKNDNVTPELVQTKNGYVVMYGDKVLSNYGTHKDLNTVIAQVHGMINDDPLGTLKSLAAVKASDASTNLHNAQAGLIPQQKALLAAQGDYYTNIKGQSPTMLVNDKGEAVPVVMSDLKRVDGVVQLPAGLRFPKDAAQATAAQNKAYETLVKSDSWLQAERKGDTAAMNKLMLGRGLDPAAHGGAGGPTWNPNPKTPTTSTTTAATPKAALARGPVTNPGPAPVREAGESFTQFRNRTLAWDMESQLFQSQQQNAASEQQRLQLLQGRPDLQMMGGGLR